MVVSQKALTFEVGEIPQPNNSRENLNQIDMVSKENERVVVGGRTSCSYCGKVKKIGEFNKMKASKLGISYECKECINNRLHSARRTKKGFVEKIYRTQLQKSKKRKHPAPTYDLVALRQWLYAQPHFHELWDNYVASDYDRQLAPSCDRKRSSKPYTLDNLQVVTWGENPTNFRVEVESGEFVISGSKSRRAVNHFDTLTGELITTYPSLQHAERGTGQNHNTIKRHALREDKPEWAFTNTKTI